MTFLVIIGKQYGDAGLEDLLVESEVLAGGSIGMVNTTIESCMFTKLFLRLC